MIYSIDGCATLHYFAPDLIEIIWDRNLSVVEEKHLRELRKALELIGKGKKMLVYVDTPDFISMSPEARKYAGSDEAQHFTKANAVLADNLAKRIMYNFFVTFSRPKTPTRAFSSQKAALDWLKKLR